MTVRKRYAPREWRGGWHVWDTLRNGPMMTADDEADAQRSADILNRDEPLLPDGYLTPIQLDAQERAAVVHWAEHDIAECLKAGELEGQYELAKAIEDYLSYAKDRMGPHRIMYLQLLWEALQKACGYEPVARQHTPS